KLAIAGAIALVIVAMVLQLVGWRVAYDETRRIVSLVADAIANAGPAVYFGAMAVLPAFGVPMAPFALGAGPLFGERLGFPTIILLGILALTLNLTVTYWLARRWLRPWLTRVLARFGYNIPQVGREDITDLIVLLRVTPGFPFFVQNYLLGLVDAPFLRYLVISCAIQWPINCGFMLFGDALSQGKGKTIITAVLLIVALSVGTQFVRRHLAKKKAKAAL
ncbi:MAG: VTT domain-containing protein, partial [Verrucomicrobiota bacterium]